MGSTNGKISGGTKRKFTPPCDQVKGVEDEKKITMGKRIVTHMHN